MLCVVGIANTNQNQRMFDPVPDDSFTRWISFEGVWEMIKQTHHNNNNTIQYIINEYQKWSFQYKQHLLNYFLINIFSYLI